MKAIPWAGRDKDHYFGPFTFTPRDSKKFAIMLGSGDSDDYPGCRLRLSVWKWTLILALPPIIKPHRVWKEFTTMNVEPGRSTGYWDTHEREYGFTISEGYISFRYGPQTQEWPGEASKGFFFPWTCWRMVRHSLYNVQGQHFADYPEHQKFLETYDQRQALKAECGTVNFDFLDYDGEQLVARTRIEEREWRWGEGRWKWLSLFRRPKISRYLEINFSGETGKRKGSWKGGTIGHSIEMLPGELHEAAFMRYCLQNDMKYLYPSQAMNEGIATNAGEKTSS